MVGVNFEWLAIFACAAIHGNVVFASIFTIIAFNGMISSNTRFDDATIASIVTSIFGSVLSSSFLIVATIIPFRELSTPKALDLCDVIIDTADDVFTVNWLTSIASCVQRRIFCTFFITVCRRIAIRCDTRRNKALTCIICCNSTSLRLAQLCVIACPKVIIFANLFAIINRTNGCIGARSRWCITALTTLGEANLRRSAIFDNFERAIVTFLRNIAVAHSCIVLDVHTVSCTLIICAASVCVTNGSLTSAWGKFECSRCAIFAECACIECIIIAAVFVANFVFGFVAIFGAFNRRGGLCIDASGFVFGVIAADFAVGAAVGRCERSRRAIGVECTRLECRIVAANRGVDGEFCAIVIAGDFGLCLGIADISRGVARLVAYVAIGRFFPFTSFASPDGVLVAFLRAILAIFDNGLGDTRMRRDIAPRRVAFTRSFENPHAVFADLDGRFDATLSFRVTGLGEIPFGRLVTGGE